MSSTPSQSSIPGDSSTPGHGSTPTHNTTQSQKSTPHTHAYHSGRNREVVSLLLKMDSTLNSLVEITKKLAAERGVKKEDGPKYTVSFLL